MTRCIECDEPFDRLELAHAAHEPDCDVDPDCEDWSCRCDAYAHRRCCRACKPPVQVVGQAQLPLASTAGMPRKRSA